MEALEADDVSRRGDVLGEEGALSSGDEYSVDRVGAARTVSDSDVHSQRILEQQRRWVANSIRQECQRAAISNDGDGRRSKCATHEKTVERLTAIGSRCAKTARSLKSEVWIQVRMGGRG